MVLMAVVCFYLFAAFSNNKETAYLYIDGDDNIDSVFTKITPMATDQPRNGNIQDSGTTHKL